MSETEIVKFLVREVGSLNQHGLEFNRMLKATISMVEELRKEVTLINLKLQRMDAKEGTNES